jgi:hypothetical protein
MYNISTKKRLKLNKSLVRELNGSEGNLVGGGAVRPVPTPPVPVSLPARCPNQTQYVVSNCACNVPASMLRCPPPPPPATTLIKTVRCA